MTDIKQNAVNENEIGEFLDCFVLTEWLKFPLTSKRISRTSFFLGGGGGGCKEDKLKGGGVLGTGRLVIGKNF